MKIKYSLLIVALAFLPTVFSQTKTIHKNKNFDKLHSYEVMVPNVDALNLEDIQREKNGEFYRIGRGISVNYTPENSGEWETLENGDKKWRLPLTSPKAQALGVLFDHFVVYGNSFVRVYDTKGNILSDIYDVKTNQPHLMQHIEMNQSDDIVVELYQAKNDHPAELSINEIAYIYRGAEHYRGNGNNNTEKDAGDSQSCQNNINCQVGANWQDEKRGVARILVKEGSNYGYCTGSLVNNLAQDCKPYFLTALHCGVNASASDFNQWKFYFNFELSGCTGTPSENIANNNNSITGCVKKATSNDGGGNSGSDFLLVQLGSSANESQTITKLKSPAINAYWNGWDANNSPTTGGAGIHHPSGDVKKISIFNGTTSTQGWNGNGKPSHWMLTWSNGVTEGGSSGSPLFNNNGGNSRIIGTLTGGSSFCTSPNAPDFYGKMSYHWDQNTTSGNIKLKSYLDPSNTGTKVLDGSSNPCSGGNPPDPNPDINIPCVSTPGQCDEYIAEVKLNTLSNSSGCDGYTYYPNKTTDLVRGQTYTIEIITGIVGSQSSLYYEDNVVAWINYNNDMTFNSNEIIFNQVPTQANPNYTSTATFTVPQNAVLGDVVLRVKIGYQDNNPCGTFDYGETEDYKVTIKDGGGSSSNAPVADFYADQNNISPNTVVSFTNTSTNNPTSNAWSITPTTGWNYASGTTASSVHPKVNFSAQGSYTVKLTASNTAGSDTETKNNYILVKNGTSSLDYNQIDNLVMYPNPTSSTLYFDKGDADNEMYVIQIIDLTGKSILRENTNHLNKFGMNVSGLAQGMYQVIITCGEKRNQFKFVKD